MTLNGDRILVPLDGSEPSFRALDAAGRLARAMDMRLDVVTVLDLTQVDVFEGFYMNDEQMRRLQERAHTEILEKVPERLGPDAPPFSSRLLHGKTLKVLLQEAAEPGVGLIVVGKTGKGVVERVLEGSVSRGLVAHAPVPVLVVG